MSVEFKVGERVRASNSNLLGYFYSYWGTEEKDKNISLVIWDGQDGPSVMVTSLLIKLSKKIRNLPEWW